MKDFKYFALIFVVGISSSTTSSIMEEVKSVRTLKGQCSNVTPYYTPPGCSVNNVGTPCKNLRGELLFGEKDCLLPLRYKKK